METYVGTCGWWYDYWHSGRFYPDDLKKYKRLDFYAKQLRAVEVNSTFYDFPPDNRVIGWHDRTPDDFKFVLKIPRLISHARVGESMVIENFDKFANVAKNLSTKFGGALLQLPPTRARDFGWLKVILDELIKRKVTPIALEFRNPTWFEITDDILADYYGKVIIVSAFWHDKKWEYPALDEMIYLRFHGTEDFARGFYSEHELSKIISNLPEDTMKMYVFFNNDYEGQAPHDAILFNKVLVNEKIIPAQIEPSSVDKIIQDAVG